MAPQQPASGRPKVEDVPPSPSRQTAFCVPSRTSFLTGLRPDATGMVHNDMRRLLGQPAATPIPPELTVAGAFRAAGYTTAAVGKLFHMVEPSAAYTLPWVEGSNDLFARPCDQPHAAHVLRAGSMPPWMGAGWGWQQSAPSCLGATADSHRCA